MEACEWAVTANGPIRWVNQMARIVLLMVAIPIQGNGHLGGATRRIAMGCDLQQDVMAPSKPEPFLTDWSLQIKSDLQNKQPHLTHIVKDLF